MIVERYFLVYRSNRIKIVFLLTILYDISTPIGVLLTHDWPTHDWFTHDWLVTFLINLYTWSYIQHRGEKWLVLGKQKSSIFYTIIFKVISSNLRLYPRYAGVKSLHVLSIVYKRDFVLQKWITIENISKPCIFDFKQIFQFDQMMVTNFFGSPCTASALATLQKQLHDWFWFDLI